MAGIIDGGGAGRGGATSIELRPGQERVFKSAGLRVRLVKVEEDSRCPQGVNCIWAGNVRVALLITGPGKTSRREVLNTASEPRELKLGGRTLTISKVSPVKIADRDPKPSDYRVTLKLSAREP
jgi:hypothetical protein